MTKYTATFFYAWDDVEHPFWVEFDWDTEKQGSPSEHKNVRGVFEACLGWTPMSMCPITDTASVHTLFEIDGVECPLKKCFTDAEIQEIESSDLLIGLGRITENPTPVKPVVVEPTTEPRGWLAILLGWFSRLFLFPMGGK